ncbi:delta(14)-sterol reductase isoform X2 [Pseudomyrmex gracilis]|nr:delta(14)-sterol reductase isoform X2 [Pseudomyrmex gracilis]
MKFTEGEEVLAKHPKNSEYYKARILDVTGDRYKIKFMAGGEHVVKETDMKYEERSTGRSRRTTKSPTRYSPSRQSERRRSPGRPRKRSPGRSVDSSPSRRSSRLVKLPIRNTRLPTVTVSRIDAETGKQSNHKEKSDTEAQDESPSETMPLSLRLRTLGMTRRSIRQSSVKTEEYKSNIMRNMDRAVSLPLERKIIDYLPEERVRGYSMQKDQDLKPLVSQDSEKWEKTVKREKEIIRVDKPQEWGGWIGTSLLILLLPLSIICPQLLCSKQQCKSAYVELPKDLESYINLRALLSYVVFLILLAFVSIIPIGKIVDGQQSKLGILQYRVNGLLSAVLAIIGFSLLLDKDVPVADYILNNIVQLSISGWLVGMILALALYIKAGRAPVATLNIHASTKSRIYNFWQGREISPRIGSLDIKLLLIRASLIGTLILNMAVGVKAIGNIKTLTIGQLDSAALLVTALQLFYIMDGLIFESAIFTSFAIMYEGTGYLTCVSHLLYPFLTTLTTRFFLYQKAKLNYFVGIFIVIFVIGYVLYRASNSQKNAFRKNPLSPTLPLIETIPTLRGKKLMVSGLWGYVRHPNYLGDIVMQWSVASISLPIVDVLPYYAAICCVFVLTYRAVRDNRRCQERYGYAWEQYTSRVKYMILKPVF